MADYADKKYSKSLKNPIIEGTDGMQVPKGTTAERVSNVTGNIRYNTDLGFLEQYNATGWAGIDAPPTVSSISGTIFPSSNSTITITGSNFKSGSTISIEGAGVSGIARNLATTFVNSGELTAATNAASVNYVAGASFDVKVTNPSGLSAVLTPAGTIDAPPVWSTGAGTIATWNSTANQTVTVTATDANSDPITYSLQSGSLPGNTNLNSSTGEISSGNVTAVSGQTTYTFTIRATANTVTADRTFNIVVNPVASGGTVTDVNISGTDYKVHSFNSGTNNFVLNSNKSIDVLLVGGGGAGGPGYGDQDTGKGGGGAGQILYRAGYSPGAGTYSITVGGGGAGRSRGNNGVPPLGNNGSNTTGFGVTANGGGGGGTSDNYQGTPRQGGSGGGAGARNGTASNNIGASSNKTNPSGWQSYGNSGGNSGSASAGSGNHGGGGGGGAGGGGGTGSTSTNDAQGGDGGAGRDYSSVFGTGFGESGWFAGGGGGGCYSHNQIRTQSSGGQGGGGQGNSARESSRVGGGTQNNSANIDGIANTGGGGGGASEDGQDSNGLTDGGGSASGSGGSGVVLIRYQV